MLDRIKALLAGPRAESADSGAVDRLQLAAAALLVEAAVTDGTFDADERDTVTRLLRERFSLDADEAATLVAEAERAVTESPQLFGFTRVISDEFSADERVEMMQMLWEVAYADGTLHDFEANLVRRVAGLIHVPDRDSGIARKRALAILGIDD
jgi:uncharacterized tellurite resistance protein B-like protein